MKKVAFYVTGLKDKIVSIDGKDYPHKPIVATFPIFNKSYFFDYFPKTTSPILCTSSDSPIKMTLVDSMNVQYAVTSEDFVGGHPSKPPHYL